MGIKQKKAAHIFATWWLLLIVLCWTLVKETVTTWVKGKKNQLTYSSLLDDEKSVSSGTLSNNILSLIIECLLEKKSRNKISVTEKPVLKENSSSMSKPNISVMLKSLPLQYNQRLWIVCLHAKFSEVEHWR